MRWSSSYALRKGQPLTGIKLLIVTTASLAGNATLLLVHLWIQGTVCTKQRFFFLLFSKPEEKLLTAPCYSKFRFVGTSLKITAYSFSAGDPPQVWNRVTSAISAQS